MPIVWNKDLDIGIDLIDSQHRKIADFINELELVATAPENVVAATKKEFTHIDDVLNKCLEYTQSHFTLEEHLQSEAGYEYAAPHKKIHDEFIRHVHEFRTRYDLDDDIGEELHHFLTRWLLQHIKNDDTDYVAAVKDRMNKVIEDKNSAHGESWIDKFFHKNK